MTEKENRLPSGGSSNFIEEQPPSTSLISRRNLTRRLQKGSEARVKFVESHLNKGLAFQIRSLRDKEQWTQAQFAEKLRIKFQNNVSARLENPVYGKHTLTTLKKIAAACDVGLVVWFVPFSRLIDWATGTPFLDKGLSREFYDVPSFAQDTGIIAIEPATMTKETHKNQPVVELSRSTTNIARSTQGLSIVASRAVQSAAGIKMGTLPPPAKVYRTNNKGLEIGSGMNVHSSMLMSPKTAGILQSLPGV